MVGNIQNGWQNFFIRGIHQCVAVKTGLAHNFWIRMLLLISLIAVLKHGKSKLTKSIYHKSSQPPMLLT